MKHTPGPWKVDDHDRVLIGDAIRVEQFHKTGLPSELRQANARLIAAAPELLQVCEKLIQYDDAPPSGTIDHGVILDNAIRMARDAIAKAKGES